MTLKKTLSNKAHSSRILSGMIAGLMTSSLLVSGAFAFQEAPMLAEMVASGVLPPVEERLPVNPRVIEAVEVGQYGGVWHRAYKGPGDRWGPTKLMEERVLKWNMGSDGTLGLKPAYIESYSVNADSSAFTFTLLEGLKWSDGHPVTTEDVQFWYEDIFLNSEIVPSIDPTFAPGGVPMALEITDERTFTVSFAQPYVYFLSILAKDSTGEPSLDRPSFLFPKHYLSQFNDHYATEEQLTAAAEVFGVEKWQDMWGSKGPATAWWQNTELPVITAWTIERPAPGDVVTMVRNPYYYAVDQEGNQLPYIDRIEHKLFDNQEAFNLMIVQGQIDLQGRYVSGADYTFYRENEERGGYHLGRWIDATTWSIIPNLNTKDEVLNALLAESDFRQALSIAIDRELINELSFSGLSEARQASPVTGSPYFNADLESHWIEYDPDAANALLDGLGLSERDDDGYRLRADGQRLTMVVQSNDAAHSNTLEILAETYGDVGIELLPRIIDRTQWDSNRDNNDFDFQWYPVDRSSVVAADPRNYMGNDSYAHQYFVWYATDGESGIEPPADHPVRDVYTAWGEASTASTMESADDALNRMLEIIVTNGWMIGVVGESQIFTVVNNDMHGFREGLIGDDITRGIGLAATQQFWIEQD